jgi:two-component system, NarL family, sensor histidine kinase DevS
MQPESRLSDDVLRRALDAAPDGIVVVDETGAMVFVNPMVEQLFEYPRDELVGMSVDVLLPESVRGLHAGRRAEYAAHPRIRSMGSGLDLRGRRRTGAEFPVEISLSPLHTGDGLFVIAVIRDVTQRRAADEELQRARETLALVDDRERIARDLHDTVIQRLFAVGLSLQAALTRVMSEPAQKRIQLAVDEIDVTIRDIRSSIFALHTRRPFAASVRDDVLVVAREAARALGFEPSVMFDGPVDSMVTDEIREHLLATLREALSNVTRHAHASKVNIELVVDTDHVFLCIRDNGVGIDSPGEGNGLRNMHQRAIAFGGSCEISQSSAAGGTHIQWRVPVDAETAR